MTGWMQGDNLTGGMLVAGQAFILQMPQRAFETAAVPPDIRCVAHAAPISKERIA